MKNNEVKNRVVEKLSLRLDNENLLHQDIWCPEQDLGLQINKHLNSSKNLNFSHIQQSWLKEKAKRYIIYKRIQGAKFSTLKGYISMFNNLAKLLNIESINSFSDINKNVIDLFVKQVSQCSDSYRRQNITSLKRIFEIWKC